jgi:hypothetical protein
MITLIALEAYTEVIKSEMRTRRACRESSQIFSWKEVLASQTLFADVEEESTLRELHDHLFMRYSLLDRVIRARKLHHSRFYSLDLDYGHQVYLDKLNGQKFTVIRALEKLERHTAEVLYKKQNWFKWVRQCQDDEEQQAETEKTKVQREAALFKRQWKQVEARLRTLRAKEEQKRQDAYLEKAYEARMLESDDSDWDPIEDFMEDERGTYIDLIKHFLWMGPSDSDIQQAEQHMADISISEHDGKVKAGVQPVNGSSLVSTPGNTVNDELETPSKKKKKKNKKKTATNAEPSDANGTTQSKQSSKSTTMPDKSKIEAEEEMRLRLSTTRHVENANMPQIAPALQLSLHLEEYPTTLAKDEIDSFGISGG